MGANFSWITVQPDGNNQTDVPYQVIMDTDESTVDSNVILCIYGENESTKSLALRRTKDGLPSQFDIKTIDVGKVSDVQTDLHHE